MAELTYPYDSEYMKYDYDEHRYILTERACLDKLNVNLSERLNSRGSANAERLANNILDDISSLVYEEIYSYTNQWEIQEYILAKVPSARKNIEDAMIKQVEYFLINGGLDNYAGVDIKKNTKMVDISDRYLAPRAKKILSRELKETKTPLLYSGKYNIFTKFDYETDKY